MGHFVESFTPRAEINVIAGLMLRAIEQRRYEMVSDGNGPEISVFPESQVSQFSHISVNISVSYLSDPFMPAWLHSCNVFQDLVSQWRKGRNALSSLAWNNVRNPSYQRIIGMGKLALPFILRELQRELRQGEPDDWFPALWAITGDNPVPPDSRGKVQEMAKAWIEWGLRNGHAKDKDLGVRVPAFGRMEMA
jgi:hypothetical protein